jgi:DNA-binding XRE family transcriptional regulator
VDISPHIRASLKDRIYRWTAEFQSRHGPLGRLYLIDAQRSTATQKTGADDGSAPAKKAPGRHKGSVVDAARLREYREGGGWSQADFASKCAVSLSTIQRGESGGPWGKGIFDKVAGTLTTLTEKHVTPKDLKKPQE